VLVTDAVADRRRSLGGSSTLAWGRARPSERSRVKAWIKNRATVMRMEALLPLGWQAALPTGHSERPNSGATESVGGQPQ
jgi:hypothetical protein